MLDLWRLAAGLEPVEAEASIERFDCLDINRRLAVAMRQWYLNLLDTADARYLAAENIADKLVWHYDATTGCKVATLPSDVRRILAVRMSATALPLKLSKNTAELADLRASVLFTRSAHSPLNFDFARRVPAPASVDKAIVADGVIALKATDPPSVVMAVSDPGDETYVLDESALSLIPSPLSL